MEINVYLLFFESCFILIMDKKGKAKKKGISSNWLQIVRENG